MVGGRGVTHATCQGARNRSALALHVAVGTAHLGGVSVHLHVHAQPDVAHVGVVRHKRGGGVVGGCRQAGAGAERGRCEPVNVGAGADAGDICGLTGQAAQRDAPMNFI